MNIPDSGNVTVGLRGAQGNVLSANHPAESQGKSSPRACTLASRAKKTLNPKVKLEFRTLQVIVFSTQSLVPCVF